MLKISRTEPAPGAVVLQLEGRVMGPWVAELRQACDHVLAANPARRLQLQLADIEFMDAEGVALLVSLRAGGVSLMDCPPFAKEQLKRGH